MPFKKPTFNRSCEGSCGVRTGDRWHSQDTAVAVAIQKPLADKNVHRRANGSAWHSCKLRGLALEQAGLARARHPHARANEANDCPKYDVDGSRVRRSR